MMGMRAQVVIPVLVSILILSILVFNPPNYAHALDTDFLFKFGQLGTGDGQFAFPSGVAVDPSSGNIVVADRVNHRIQVFDSSGSFLTKFGSFGSGDGQFSAPLGVAVDPSSGNIVVADENNHRIQVFDSSGSFLTKFGSLGSGNGQFSLSSPVGVAVDPSSGNIVVADFNNHRIQVFDSSGSFLTKFGSLGSGDGQFNLPLGVTVDPSSGNILVADRNNNRIQVFGTLSIQDQINQINGLENVSNNVKISLVAPLNQAITLLEDGMPQNDVSVCGKITAFLSVVDAKEGTMELTSVQASELRATAQSIENSLGC